MFAPRYQIYQRVVGWYCGGKGDTELSFGSPIWIIAASESNKLAIMRNALCLFCNPVLV